MRKKLVLEKSLDKVFSEGFLAGLDESGPFTRDAIVISPESLSRAPNSLNKNSSPGFDGLYFVLLHILIS